MFAMLGLVREPFKGRESLGRVCGVLVMGLLVCEQEIEDSQIETKGGPQGCRENGRKKERITVRNKSGVCHPDVWLPSGSVVGIRGTGGGGGNGTILLEIPSCCFCHPGTTLPQNGIT